MKYIPYGRQFIDNSDKKSVLKALSNDLITTGPLVARFERQIKNTLSVNIAMYVVVEPPLFIWHCYQLV